MWWDNNYTDRKRISIPAKSGGYAVGDVAQVTIETHTLITPGLMRPDRKDLRIVHDTGTAVEIDRTLSTTATIIFKIQATIPTNTVCLDYWLYYGNPAASAAPENLKNIYPAFLNGADISQFTVSGGVTAPNLIRPRFTKIPTKILPASGTVDAHGTRDAEGIFYENGNWYIWYNAYSTSNLNGVSTDLLAKGPDILNLTRMGWTPRT